MKSFSFAAVYDHFHAVVMTITRKLARGRRSAADDATGGSTYTFEVWPGHPLETEVRGLLSRFRAEHTRLRERVRAVAASEPATRTDAYQVVVYGGQYTVEDEEE